MSADLGQNIIQTIYATFIHNYLVIAYFAGAVLAAILALIKPSRYHLLLLFGFGLLMFAFEYDKHIAAPFEEQTIQSLITLQEHHKVRRLVDFAIYEMIPVASFLVGWICIFIAMIVGGRTSQPEGKPKE